MPTFRSRLLITAAVLAAAPLPTFGQDAPPQGLDALDGQRVLSGLASRNLEALLRHALDAEGVPEGERDALLSGLALGRLQSGEAIGDDQRRQLVLDVVRDVGRLIDQEPRAGQEAQRADLLMAQSQTLIDQGVGQEVRLLEYFGDNAERRRYVGAVAEAVGGMLRRAAELYDAAAEEIAGAVMTATDPRIAEAKRYQGRAQQANQLALFADYYRLLALDPSDPERINLGDRLVAQVRPLDREGNPQRAFVRQFLGKLALARGGKEGRELARTAFEGAIADAGDDAQAFDSYFGRTAVEAASGEVEASREQLDRFRSWFDRNEANLAGREPLMLVAGYRVEEAASNALTDAAAREAAEDGATAYLTQLVEEYDGYRPVVTGQLLARVDAGTDLSTLPPLLLDAVVDRGRSEAAKLAANAEAADDPNRSAEPADPALVAQGIAAARELLARREARPEEVDPQVASRNAFVLAAMLQVSGEPLEAAEAYLSFGDMAGVRQEQRLSAYRRALGIVDQVRRDSPEEGQIVRADEIEAGLLPTLVDEFGDARRAFDLANRLHRMNRLEEAAEYYAKVPADDPRRPEAQFLRTVADAARAAELPPDSPVRATLLNELPQLGDDAVAALQDAAESAPADRAQAYRQRALQLRVTLARLALDADDPQRALALLGDVERQAEGVEGGGSIVREALPLRFQATAAAGEIDRATADLLAILEGSDSQRGLAFIGQFRQTLDAAFDRAAVRGDRGQMRRVMETRAAVTPRLVEWIGASDDPNYRRYAYNFARDDAKTQLDAALLTDDEGARRGRLEQAVAALREVAAPEGVRQYRALLEGLTDEQREQVTYDREVVLNLGRAYFELGDYEEARSRFARLLADRALGEATRTVVEGGVERTVPNDDFWEAQLRYLQSTLRGGGDREAMAGQLRRLYVIHGEAVGGRRWRREYGRLREELGVEAPAATART